MQRVNSIKKVNINQMNEILYLFGSILCILMSDHSAYVILLFSLFVILSEKKRPRKDEIRIVLLLLAGTVTYLIFNFRGGLDLLSGNMEWLQVAIDMSILVSAIFHIQARSDKLNKQNKTLITFYKLSYYMIYAISVFEVFKFILTHWITGNDPRAYRYLYGLHESDFAVILIFAFSWGIKLKKYNSVLFLALLSFFFVPSRTYKFFIILFALITIFKRELYRIRKLALFNSYFKIIIFIIAFMAIFSSVWVLVLSWKYQLNESHVGIFDISNQGRMESILYAFRVIVEQLLIFKGIPISVMGSSVYSDMASMRGFHATSMFFPHNTYLLLLVQYSVVVGLIYLYVIARVFEKLKTKINDTIILSYLITACVLHNMLSAGRLFILITILMITEYGDYKYRFKLKIITGLNKHKYSSAL